MNQDDLGALLPLVLLLAVAYFLLIRPARKRARDTANLQSALSPGDDVMTTSGIFGHVVAVADEYVELEVAPGTVLKMHRGAVGKIVTDVSSPTTAPVGEDEVDPGSQVELGGTNDDTSRQAASDDDPREAR